MVNRRVRIGWRCVGLLLMASLAGCAGKAEKKAWLRYAEQLSPAVGEASSDDFVREWGMPHKQLDLEDGYAYNWYFSKGTRSVGFAYFISVGESRAAYDDVTLFFDEKDILREWKVECER